MLLLPLLSYYYYSVKFLGLQSMSSVNRGQNEDILVNAKRSTVNANW